MALERPSNAAFRLACPLAPNAASATLPAPSLPASSNVQQNASNQTIREMHDGSLSAGQHARYVLRSLITILEKKGGKS